MKAWYSTELAAAYRIHAVMYAVMACGNLSCEEVA